MSPIITTPEPGTDVNTAKYTTLFHYIHNLSMRNVRDVYRGIRESGTENPNIFFPRKGITTGEFAVAIVIKVPRHARGG